MPIRQREVYWIKEGVPELDGETPGPHFCIVLDASAILNDPTIAEIEVVFVSSKAWQGQPKDDKNPDRIKLRWGPGTAFNKACWAIPRWTVLIDRKKLIESRPQVSGKELFQLLEARNKRHPNKRHR